MLSSRHIATALAGHPIGHDVQVYPSLSSTSDHVRDLGHQGYPHGLVVFAEEQTHGRGRRDNRWQSEPGENLLFSILLRPDISVDLWPRLTSIAALAICQAIDSTTSLSALIKWPNDIHLHGKKTAGILAETFVSPQGPFMILGIGLNVNTARFPAELEPVATSLKLAAGHEIERARLAIALLKALNRLIPHWHTPGFRQIIDGIRPRSLLLGRTIHARLDQREIHGQAIDLDENGCLIITLPDGSTTVLTSAEQVRWT